MVPLRMDLNMYYVLFITGLGLVSTSASVTAGAILQTIYDDMNDSANASRSITGITVNVTCGDDVLCGEEETNQSTSSIEYTRLASSLVNLQENHSHVVENISTTDSFYATDGYSVLLTEIPLEHLQNVETTIPPTRSSTSVTEQVALEAQNTSDGGGNISDSYRQTEAPSSPSLSVDFSTSTETGSSKIWNKPTSTVAEPFTTTTFPEETLNDLMLNQHISTARDTVSPFRETTSVYTSSKSVDYATSEVNPIDESQTTTPNLIDETPTPSGVFKERFQTQSSTTGSKEEVTSPSTPIFVNLGHKTDFSGISSTIVDEALATGFERTTNTLSPTTPTSTITDDTETFIVDTFTPIHFFETTLRILQTDAQDVKPTSSSSESTQTATPITDTTVITTTDSTTIVTNAVSEIISVSFAAELDEHTYPVVDSTLSEQTTPQFAALTTVATESSPLLHFPEGEQYGERTSVSPPVSPSVQETPTTGYTNPDHSTTQPLANPSVVSAHSQQTTSGYQEGPKAVFSTHLGVVHAESTYPPSVTVPTQSYTVATESETASTSAFLWSVSETVTSTSHHGSDIELFHPISTIKAVDTVSGRPWKENETIVVVPTVSVFDDELKIPALPPNYKSRDPDELTEQEKAGVVTAIFSKSEGFSGKDWVGNQSMLFHVWVVDTVLKGIGNASMNWHVAPSVGEISPDRCLPELNFVVPTPVELEEELIFTFLVKCSREDVTISAGALLPILVSNADKILNILSLNESNFVPGFFEFNQNFDYEDVIPGIVFEDHGIILIAVTAAVLLVIFARLVYLLHRRWKSRAAIHCITDRDKLDQDMHVALEVGDINSAVVILRDEMQETREVKNGKLFTMGDDEGWVVPVNQVPRDDKEAPDVQDTKL